MVIKKIVLGHLQTNCYVIENNGECVIIDPPSSFEYLECLLVSKRLKLKAILLTHGHFDHCAICYKFQEKGIPIYMSEKDALVVKNSPKLFGLTKENSFEANYFINGGECIELIGKKIYVISSSGHTDGSISFLIDDNLFCGDTIFAGGGIGRCDLYSGNFEKIQDTILNTLFKLDDETKVFCGHGEDTTIGQEKKLIHF